MGLHPRISVPMRTMYNVMQSRFRCGPGIGKPFLKTNGLLQGCAMSVVFINAFMSIWAHAVNEAVKGASPDLFADDVGAT
eukprot:7150824-Karenia_brevis.AAC.1